MQLTDDFKSKSRENAEGKVAASCQGLNEGIWVLNSDTQIDQHGNLLADDATKFIWLGKYVAERSGILSDKHEEDISKYTWHAPQKSEDALTDSRDVRVLGLCWSLVRLHNLPC